MPEWALITGGGGGIGAALAVELATSDYKVLVVDINFDILHKHLGRTSQGDRIVKLKADASEEATLSQISAAIPPGDKIRFFVHCALVSHVAKLQDVSRQMLERVFSVNVFAPFLLIQHLLPRLQESKTRILHMDTLVDHYPKLGCLCYGVSKAAHHKLGQQLKLELADTTVKIAAVYPGVVKTGAFYSNLEAMKKAGLYKENTDGGLSEIKKNDSFLTPVESARFLKYILLETADEEFVEQDWSANDKKYWPQWKQN